MLKRSSAALLGMVLFAGSAAAQETTIKFTLGWKTQGSDAAFFYAQATTASSRRKASTS